MAKFLEVLRLSDGQQSKHSPATNGYITGEGSRAHGQERTQYSMLRLGVQLLPSAATFVPPTRSSEQQVVSPPLLCCSADPAWPQWLPL
jgi:hypothetical protein